MRPRRHTSTGLPLPDSFLQPLRGLHERHLSAQHMGPAGRQVRGGDSVLPFQHLVKPGITGGA
jgi:hypothetical protein